MIYADVHSLFAYVFINALYNKHLCLLSHRPLVFSVEGCVTPLAPLSEVAALHNEGSGAVLVELELGRICAHIKAPHFKTRWTF